MAKQIAVGPVHHLALTVSDLERSLKFYNDVLGFAQVAEFGARRILSNGSLIIGIGTGQHSDDRFDEMRTGLDHISFAVPARADLERALEVLDEHGVPHGEIAELAPFGIAILAFRDPDNIQLELSAPLT
ncbi:MAG TPA: VOC family protein [Roseiflexaceae bacterium]|nr:VOC family protein [Roseiflexaceae bacterium]